MASPSFDEDFDESASSDSDGQSGGQRATVRNKRKALPTFDDVARLFHLPMKDVVQRLGVCGAVVKRICSRNGIHRWPYRKVQAAHRKSGSLGAAATVMVLSARQPIDEKKTVVSTRRSKLRHFQDSEEHSPVVGRRTRSTEPSNSRTSSGGLVTATSPSTSVAIPTPIRLATSAPTEPMVPWGNVPVRPPPPPLLLAQQQVAQQQVQQLQLQLQQMQQHLQQQQQQFVTLSGVNPFTAPSVQLPPLSALLPPPLPMATAWNTVPQPPPQPPSAQQLWQALNYRPC